MAKFGITGLIVKANGQDLSLVKRSRRHNSSWTKNISATVNPAFKNVISNPMYFPQIMREMLKEGSIAVYELVHVFSNENLVPLTTLYGKGDTKYYCVFLKNKFGERSLVCLDCCRAREIVHLGYDAYNKARVPFVFKIENKTAIPVNIA